MRRSSSTTATNRHMIFFFFFILAVVSTECHIAAAFHNNNIPTRGRSSGVFTSWVGRWHHHSTSDSPLQQLCAVSQSSSSSSKLTPLPLGLSPFDKSVSKTYDVQGTFRVIAVRAIQNAIPKHRNKNVIYEIEVPPLLSNGMDMSKNQFDDFDNVQELNANRNWCLQLIPKLLQSSDRMKTNLVWLILPDDKECELAQTAYREEFRYSPTTTMQFTSLRAAFSATTNGVAYVKAWGSSLAETVDKLQGGDGILADSSTLDTLDIVNRNRIQIICQPGNGGPVEDWINVEQFCYQTVGHPMNPNQNSNSDSRSNNSNKDGNHSNVVATIIVNGALDKVRDGYYPPIFFPALAKTRPFYQNCCEPILFVKPISDKGYYGWIFRVYPEPWQIILQLPKRVSTNENSNDEKVVVEDIVVLVSETRPSYQEAVTAMVQEAQKRLLL